MTFGQFIVFLVIPFFIWWFFFSPEAEKKVLKKNLEFKARLEKEQRELERKALEERKIIEEQELKEQKKEEEKNKKINRLLYLVGDYLHEDIVEFITNEYPLLPIHLTNANLNILLEFHMKKSENLKIGIYKGLNEYKRYVVRQYKNYNYKVENQALNYCLFSEKDFWLDERNNRETEKSMDPVDWSKRRKIVYNRENGKCQRCGLRLELARESHIHHVIPRLEQGNHKIENLALFCKDCHSFMPSYGHKDSRATDTYYISRNKVAHTTHCRYANDSQKQVSTHAKRLQTNGYGLCKVCQPLIYHDKLLKEWTPEIELYISDIIEIIVESSSEIKNLSALK